MPDLDLLRRGVHHCWRPTYRIVAGGASVSETVPSAVRALCAMLRQRGGVPSLDAQSQILSDVRTAAISDSQGLLRSREIAAAAGGTVQGLIAQRALGRLIVSEQHRDTTLQSSLSQAVTKQHCNETLETEIFAKLRTGLVGQRFQDLPAAEVFVHQLRTALEPAVSSIAEKLATDPHATKLRAPRSTEHSSSRRPTAELLNQQIG